MLWSLFIGAVAGWLAGKIFRGGGFGLVGDIIVGVVGAFIGGILFNLIGINAYGTIGSIITATVGAVVFLWILRMFTGAGQARR
ncbi:MAG: GlsB/YeaQ/YmgE family stress response membrane protein [Negativicutes bacterium]|nr:GlsB/YeaQ/YmgE family stress response membrane protein [Negativicutes bacterium]